MPLDPTDPRSLFIDGVNLLGGTRQAARELGISERAINRLNAGSVSLHEGFLRDMAIALSRRAEACRALEMRISPLFTASLTDDQPPENR